jgi:hypothetical protein
MDDANGKTDDGAGSAPYQSESAVEPALPAATASSDAARAIVQLGCVRDRGESTGTTNRGRTKRSAFAARASSGLSSSSWWRKAGNEGTRRRPMNRWKPQFDVYGARLQADRAMIRLDLAARAYAPVATHSSRLTVGTTMRSPRADGLRSNEEAPALSRLRTSWYQFWSVSSTPSSSAQRWPVVSSNGPFTSP